MKRLLIVDDELGSRESLKAIFSKDHVVIAATNAEEALARLAAQPVDLMLADFIMPGRDGIWLVKEAQALYPDLPCIMVSASSAVRGVVDAIRAGAMDYISKPYDVEEIRRVVSRALESTSLKRRVEILQNELARNNPTGAIGNTPVFLRVLDAARMAAETDATVLITGESGTGKELVARTIHSLSSRRDEPFVALHCGALPETLMESELFGHEKGAFTNADKRKPGRFDLAANGTIFFDEVSEMSLATQVKLLRVLQEREYMRVGGTQVLRTNARVLAACNRDLKKEMLEKRFREDLYYRLNVVPIHVPPLRERRDDIPILVRFFLDHFRRNMNLRTEDFAPDTLDLLTRYDWPGNVRELRNVLERVLVLHGKRTVIMPSNLPEEFRAIAATAPTADTAAEGTQDTGPAADPAAATDAPAEPLLAPGQTFDSAVHDFEESLIRGALTQAAGNKSRAAEILGTTRRILTYKMDNLGIPDAFGTPAGAP